ncbi:MAG: trypsin-like peptidase domain-containing protein [Bosea sp.]|uniref:trypsin-like peptidase domain-containing protein n=1 Tax=Bosea sp. (in: a-proteobacteria) TaxID=1871050 RepID=UPI00238C7671|nr:trypsin-like peptidase domain-containing protein [Bosea sp. (in: a-proteobacteria)]MCP4740222.1 trypsin-like peptidase domain-containing protein [Bosea sp. (in: a-proteobacteria)]
MSSYLSFSATPIEIFTAERRRIDSATGFFFGHGTGSVFLVTNWHVVTGRKPQKPAISERGGAIPVWATIKYHRFVGDGHYSPGAVDQLEFRLNDETGERPTWLEHPTYRNKADVVCIRLPKQYFDPDAPRVWRHLEESDFEITYRPKVMHDAFVIGYPWGLTGGGTALPIFKRGSVASEPAVPHRGLPRFLIDCRTAGGMSGAPVIGATSGLWGSGAGISNSDIIGTVMGFIGVYSGRLEAEELDAFAEAQPAISEIGLVWRPEIVTEIITGGVSGRRLSELT